MLIQIDHSPLPSPLKINPKLLEKIIEFFTARIQNINTRSTYFNAIRTFASWMEQHSLNFDSIKAPHIALYLENSSLSTSSKKIHLAALRSLLKFLVSTGSLPSGIDPSHSVKGPPLTRTLGKTPYLSSNEVLALLQAIEGNSLKALRDKALVSTMLYTFARVSAVTKIKREDYYSMNKRSYLRLYEKGGKEHLLPVHHLAEKTLDDYLALTQIKDGDFIFQSLKGRGTQLSGKAISRIKVYDMIKIYAAKAGLNPKLICCHSMRATGITTFLKNGGSLEEARKIANHVDSKTTRLYDRRHQEITVSEIERIRFD